MEKEAHEEAEAQKEEDEGKVCIGSLRIKIWPNKYVYINMIKGSGIRPIGSYLGK